MCTQIRYLKEQLITICTRSLFTTTYSSFRRVNSRSNSSLLQNHDIYLWNSTITNYFRNGDVVAARQLFDEMPWRNLVTWNCMVSGYLQNHRVVEARKIFDVMPRRNVVSWTALFTGYARCGRLEEAQELFDRMPERNIVCWNSMISGCMNNGVIGKARQLFDKMPLRNSVSWVIMIRGYLQHELVTEARELFDRAPMKEISLYNALLSGYVELGYHEYACELFNKMALRDVASWTTMITCYARAGKMEIAGRLFEEMPERDIAAWTTIIRGYLQNGQVKVARKLFDEMPHRDIIAWNSMIGGYVQNGMLEDALHLFMQMPKPNIVSWNSILQGYVQLDDMANAFHLFEKMPQKDQTSWNTLITGSQNEEAFVLFSRMFQEGFKPDQGTLAIVISVCASLATLSCGTMLHLCAIKAGYENDTTVNSSLITMYSKCGLINDAARVFESMSKRDTIAWNAVIVAQSYHGSTVEVLELFPAMIQAGLKPDYVTFLGLLSACAHRGLVDEGLKYFVSMQKDWKLIPKPEHYACVVDLLGRLGLLTKAYDFIKDIPVDLPVSTWETLLSSCRVHGNLDLGELVAKTILTSQPSNGGVYVLLSNIYAAKGMWKDATSIRALMKTRGAKKEPACSWIEIKGRISAFVYNDRSHPLVEEIYKVLKTLSIIMEEISWPWH